MTDLTFGLPSGVLVAIIGSSGSIVVAFIYAIFRFIGDRRLIAEKAQERMDAADRRADDALRELRFQSQSLGFDEFESVGKELEQEIYDLLDSTAIDRVLKLKAWNGENTMNYVTAYVQYRGRNQRMVNYVNYPVDEDYNRRVHETFSRGDVVYEVVDDPQSNIMQSYIAEKVKRSMWIRGATVRLVGSNSQCKFFMSFATHADTPIDLETQEMCRRICDKHRARVESYHSMQSDTEVVR